MARRSRVAVLAISMPGVALGAGPAMAASPALTPIPADEFEFVATGLLAAEIFQPKASPTP